MNLENLRENYQKLLLQMKESGYSKRYVADFKREIQWILSKAATMGWKRYEDVYQYHAVRLTNPNSLAEKHTIIGAIKRFDLHGKYLDSKRYAFIKDENDTYSQLIPAFKELIDCFIKAEGLRGIKTSSINTKSSNASNFLLAMQKAGFRKLSDITEDAVMSQFLTKEGEQIKSSTYRRSVAAMLKVCTVIDSGCQKVLLFIPMTRSTRNNIQYLTANEIIKIRAALDDTTNTLSLCYRAIGKLALYTGLRSSDLAALNMTSIDWEHDRIKIKSQQKTNVPLELPLTATVGNAIYEYLCSERRASSDPALFLSSVGQIRRMTARSMGNVAIHIMKAADVRQAVNNRKGLHLFRHNIATTLLGNEVSRPVISHILGQSSPNTLETYLSADFVHLKACALDISCFPLAKEVFGDE
jgi:integrase